MIEHALSPNKPIYLLGDSFGGALALAVAACNPSIDLVLILANPATAYERSPVHPLVGFMRTLPDELYWTFPYATCFLLGDFIKMSMVNSDGTNNSPSLLQLVGKITRNLPLYSLLTKILPKKTLEWKIELVKQAAGYANSRLHTVTAQVLVLASGKDNLLPSKDEAERLSRSLKHCKSFITKRDMYNVRRDANMVVKDIVEDGSCKWPEEWIVKYPILALHQNIEIYNDKEDKIVWRTKDEKDRNFTVNQAYYDLSCNDETVKWSKLMEVNCSLKDIEALPFE
nr:diacylglycerol acyltransferase [Tanacetum cinerariifolium]